MYYIYGILNKINNKYYIGKTNNIKKRFRQHILLSSKPKHKSYSYLHKAINRYGENNFEVFKLDSFDNEEECYLFETKYIELLKSNDQSIGYNMSLGGSGGLNPNESTRKKISDKRKGFKFSEESIEQMRKSHIGQKSILRKLSNDQALQIKQIFDYCKINKIKINYNSLYETYGLKKGAIKNIVWGTTYKEIKYELSYINKKLSLSDYKMCTKCKCSKPTSEFTPNKKLICGFESHCRLCNSSYKINKKKINKNKTNKTIKDDMIYDICKLYYLGSTKKDLCKLFNIGRTSIYKIISGTY